MAKYLKNDEEIRVLRTEKELEEYLAFRKEDDRWYAPYINEITAIGVENTPLSLVDGLKEHGIEESESVMETIEDYGLFIDFPRKDGSGYLPLRGTAFIGLCKVSGTNCRAVTNYTPKAKDRLLPLKTKAEWITTGCSLREIPCKILFRDEKVSAVATRRYEILPQWELVDALTDAIGKEFTDFSFHKAEISHDYSSFSYRIHDEEMEDCIKGFLADCNVMSKEIKVGVSLATSDIGLSRAYAYLYFEYDGVLVQLGNIAEMIHDFGNTVSKFRGSIKNIGEAFRENEDRIEELGNTEITDVPNCVKNILETYPIFPSKIAEPILEEFTVKNGGKTGTAADCYLSFFSMAEKARQGGIANPRSYIETMQRIAKMLTLRYTAFDK